MSNRRATITQSEIARAVKAAQGAGLAVSGYEVDHNNGTVRVWAKGGGPAADDLDAMIENAR